MFSPAFCCSGCFSVRSVIIHLLLRLRSVIVPGGPVRPQTRRRVVLWQRPERGRSLRALRPCRRRPAGVPCPARAALPARHKYLLSLRYLLHASVHSIRANASPSQATERERSSADSPHSAYAPPVGCHGRRQSPAGLTRPALFRAPAFFPGHLTTTNSSKSQSRYSHLP